MHSLVEYENGVSVYSHSDTTVWLDHGVLEW